MFTSFVVERRGFDFWEQPLDFYLIAAAKEPSLCTPEEPTAGRMQFSPNYWVYGQILRLATASCCV